MNRSDIHLLDLPVEILLKILKKLNNMDVLYSLIGVKGLDIVAQDEIFTNALNFVLPGNDDYDSIDEAMIYYLELNSMLDVLFWKQQLWIEFYVLVFIQMLLTEVQNLPHAPPAGGGNFLKNCITRGNF